MKTVRVGSSLTRKTPEVGSYGLRSARDGMVQGRIRTAVDEDLPAIVALHTKIYPHSASGSRERRVAYLTNILLQHPWRTERFPSLVYEDVSGEVTGLLGVMPRPMRLHGDPMWMAISHNYMVAPDSRSALVSVRLAQAFFRGSQTLCVCQPQDMTALKIARACGASLARLYSFMWVRPLRPAAYVAERLQERCGSPTLWRLLVPLCRLLDAGVRRCGHWSFQLPEQRHVVEDLTVETLLECLLDFSSRRTLRPEYDVPALSWLIAVAKAKTRYGKLRVRRVRKDSGHVIGYYLYYANRDGVSYVLQVVAHPDSVGVVLDELAREAWEGGAVALCGPFDPYYAEELAAKALYIKYDYRAPVQIHSTNPAVDCALASGNAFLSPLEREWALWCHDAGEQKDSVGGGKNLYDGHENSTRR